MKISWRLISLCFFIWCAAITAPNSVSAEENPLSWVGKIVSVQGQVYVKRAGAADWRPVDLNDTFFAGDTLRVAVNSRAGLLFSNESTLRVDQHTTLIFNGIEKKKTFLMELLKGAAYFFSRQSRSLKVSTPFVNGVVEGTEFLVQVDSDKTDITLYEGAVLARNPMGEITMTKGQTVTASTDQPPVIKTVVHPRDAVQWALYYPPIIKFSKDFFQSDDPNHWTWKLHRSIEALDDGDYLQAFEEIKGLEDTVNDARFYVYRAGLRLFVGRVDTARQDIERALHLDDKNSAALALQAIIAVVQNRREDALQDARMAVHLTPRSAAARLALSYALQAHFELEAALEAVRSVVSLEPRNGLAWARLAELYLSTGDLDMALTAAQNAAAIFPKLAHIQTVLGFAYLTQIKIEEAQEAFNTAIALDSAAPLPRLGLGLAQIRRGHLEEGRGQIEIAVALDPGNALLRSYLGKAYFDEKRPLDERQFEMAKTLDPMDPTPWFYDAIRKQSLNRPIEALHDLEKSIELNDNRAVYRSRLLLDEDLAARSTHLGRIYSDIGFEKKAIREAYNSLAVDPTNYSAHQLLADAYNSQPWYKISRVSELLQAQLLQPAAIKPFQPQMAESNLLVGSEEGSSSPSYNNYDSLFARNGALLSGDAFAGTNQTFGEYIALSGIHDRLSCSAGQYHYESNGYRENNGLSQNLHNVFAQYALKNNINIQAEYRYRNYRHGDLTYDFDLDDPNTTYSLDAQTTTLRTGLNYSPKVGSNLIASFIIQDSEEVENYTESFEIMGMHLENPFKIEYESDGWLGELQYIYRRSNFNIALGGGHFNSDTDYAINQVKGNFKTTESNGYLYANLSYPSIVTWTFGASYDVKRETSMDKDDAFDPKLGINWHLLKNSMLRLTFFKTTKRSLITDQTIEPTQIAGFNQFFDDYKGSHSSVYGVALDHKFSHGLSAGLEYYKRDIQRSVDLASSEQEEDWEEDKLNAYLCWTPLKVLSMSINYEYELFQKDLENAFFSQPPAEMITQIVPFKINYFHCTGFYGSLTSTYVFQEISPFDSTAISEKEDFTLVDLAVGFKIPQRHGKFSIKICNLFDRDFNYKGNDDRTPAGVIDVPAFIPERTVLLHLAFSF